MKYLRIAVISLFLGLCLYLATQIQVPPKQSDDLLRLTACDVGQGDAILISLRSTQVLVDAGRGEKVLSCLWSELPMFDRTLELAVATHPDADHIGGFPVVFDQFIVQSLLLPPVTRKTADFVALTTAVSREEELIGRVLPAQAGQIISLADGFTLTVLAPQKTSTETELSAFAGFKPVPDVESNDWSIVLLLQYKSFSALLAADAETPIELALLQAGSLSDVDVLKVGHHGSKSSTSEAFLHQITPETSLISVGENNPYGHPTEEVMSRLTKNGIQILRTDELGSISIESDGTNFWVAQ